MASRQQVLEACRQLLRPIIHVLLLCGVTSREFADLAKSAYVDVASKKFGKRGRLTNVSRTAVLTGLSRREVRKQRELLAEVAPVPSGYVAKASLVLSTWHLDPEFLAKKGVPARLLLEGERRSFASLVQRCAGADVPATTLLKELIDAGAVRVRARGELEVLQRNFIPHPMHEKLVRLWGSVIADVANTYVHNLTKSPEAQARFERAAVNDRIDPRALPEFRKFLEREGQQFLERADVWLTAHQLSQNDDRSDMALRLGVGTYHIQD
ncbi:MAG: DUF6502 family protein [Gammaproteobacteria bacterium]